MRKFIATIQYSTEKKYLIGGPMYNRQEFNLKLSTICKTCGKPMGDHWGKMANKAEELNCPLYSL